MDTRKIFLSFVCIFMAAGCTKNSEPAVEPEQAEIAAPTDEATAEQQESKSASDVVPTARGELRIVPIHHGSVLFEIAGSAIYVDPVKDAKLEGLPKADAIFITHGHPDHLDLDAIEQVRIPSKTVVIAPPTVAGTLPKSMDRVTVMRAGEASGAKAAIVPSLGSWFGVEAVEAYNLARGPEPGKLFHPKGDGIGYVLHFGDKRVYISGDTECTEEMRALKDIDVAFVCMNLPYTMTPSEAAECIKAFKPKIIYPYHYRDSDLLELDTALKGVEGIEVRQGNWY